MKKGLFIAFEFNLLSESEYMNSESGIEKKIFSQYNTFKKSGFDMRFYNPYSKRNILKRKIRRRLPFFSLTRWDDFEFNNLDFIYIRKPWFMDGDTINYLKKVKRENRNCKIIMEIPTFPYDNELLSWTMIPLKYKDRYWRKSLQKYVDKIVTYSNDKKIFNVPTLNISNAMDVMIDNINFSKKYDGEINFMLCATLANWHGYDRAIEGLANYYKNGGKRKLILHIVGDGIEKQNYIDLVKKYKLEENVIFYGKLYGKDLLNVYNISHIGIDSLGRHRTGVYYNSSLKGKEYASNGLPIVSGVETELDKEKDFRYYFRVPANETPLDFNKIVIFSDRCYSLGVEKTQREIINYSKNNFSYISTMKKIVDYINS